MDKKPDDSVNVMGTSKNTSIRIQILRLENIRIKEFPITVDFNVEYGEKSLLTIPSVSVDAPDIEIDGITNLEVDVKNHEDLNRLAGTPVAFKIEQASVTEKKEAKGKKSGGKEVKFGGKCYLDLLPILLGETVLEDQPLIVEVSAYRVGQEMVPWTHLPILHVKAEIDEPLVSKDVIEKSNVLSFTLESIYNVTEEMPQNLVYTAGINFPIDKNCHDMVEFKGGVFDTKRDIENIKHWHGIPFAPGRNALTKQRVSEDHHEIRNYTESDIDMNVFLRKDQPHIRWNTLKRSFLSNGGIEKFKEILMRKNCIPMEFLVESLQEFTSDKHKSKIKFQEPIPVLHMVTYLNLSPLTYPGVSRIRLASPLEIYDEELHAEKCVTTEPFFDVVINPFGPPKEETSGKDKKKTKQPKREKPTIDPEIVKTSKFFVIIEVEFLQPLLSELSLDDIRERIYQLIPDRPELPIVVPEEKLALERFRECIKVLHGKMNEEYKKFVQHVVIKSCRSCVKPYPSGRDILPCFVQFLKTTDAYMLIQQTIQSRVTEFMRIKLRKPLNEKDFFGITSEIENLVIYLTEEMNKVMYFQVDNPPKVIKSPEEYVTHEMIRQFAFEALEEDRLEEANRWFLKRLDAVDGDPEVWVDYALYHLRIAQINDAMECLKKALEIDRQHFVCLLLYAIILTEQDCFNHAKTFFQALTTIYSHNHEAWIAFNIFFVHAENKVGQEETQRRAFSQQETSLEQPTFKQEKFMSWHDMKGVTSPYLKAASLFLKIHALQFADMALAKELAHTHDERSVFYDYYSAVLNYLRGDFECVDRCLQKVIPGSQDYSPWCLAGHACYKLKRTQRALCYYRYACHYLQPPPDYHMLYLRVGISYHEEKHYDSALDMLTLSCKFYGTPYSWYRAGLAAFEMEDYESSELALGESNLLDKYTPNTWGLLALIHLLFKRMETFNFCYDQAKKLNFNNEYIEDKISRAKQKNNTRTTFSR